MISVHGHAVRMPGSIHDRVPMMNRIFDLIDSLGEDPDAVEVLLSSAIILHLESGGTPEDFTTMCDDLVGRLKDFKERMDP